MRHQAPSWTQRRPLRSPAANARQPFRRVALNANPVFPQAGIQHRPRSAAAKTPVSAPAYATDGAPSPRDKGTAHKMVSH